MVEPGTRQQREGGDAGRELRRFAQFCLVGSSGAVVDMGVLGARVLLLVRGVGLGLLPANGLAIGVVAGLNFGLSRFWAWGGRRERPNLDPARTV